MSVLLKTSAALIVASITIYFGWTYYDSRYPEWIEDVRLSDGRVITIEQKHETYADYGTHQSWVSIDLPELGGKQVWSSNLMPQRVDVADGKVYVFGSPRGIRQNKIYQYPKYYMVGFVWSGREFTRIPFLKIPEKIRSEENIYPCVPEPRVGHLTLAQKDAKWCPERGDQWKFGKTINIEDYESLANFYAKLDGGKPLTD